MNPTTTTDREQWLAQRLALLAREKELSRLGDDHFQQVLPLVRRTFADFSRSERRSIAERAARPPEAPADTAPADAAPPWQVGRVAQALPLLHRLLGLPPEAVSSMENPPDVR